MKLSSGAVVGLTLAAAVLCHCQPSSPAASPGRLTETSAADDHADRVDYVRAFLDAELGSSGADPRSGWSESDRERTATMIAALSMHEVWGGNRACVPTTSEEARAYLAALRLQLEETPEDESVWRLRLFADALQEMAVDGISLVPEISREEE